MEYFSKKYNIHLTYKDIQDLFYDYLLLCKINKQIPEYNNTEFLALNKDEIEINFIDLLIYYSKLKKHINQNT